MIHRHKTWQLQPVRMNGTTHRYVIPRERKRVEESSQVASFTLRKLFLLLGWIPPLRFAAVGMTDVFALVVTNSNVQQFRPPGAGWRQIAAATPVTSNGTPYVAAMIHRQATFRIQPVWLNGTTPRHVIPRERKRVEESSQVASFTLRRLLLLLGKIPPLRYATVGMTDVFCVGWYKFK